MAMAGGWFMTLLYPEKMWNSLALPVALTVNGGESFHQVQCSVLPVPAIPATAALAMLELVGPRFLGRTGFQHLGFSWIFHNDHKREVPQ